MSFLKKHPFWFGCIIGIVVLIGVYFFLVFPQQRANAALDRDVSSLQSSIEEVLKGKGLLDSVRKELDKKGPVNTANPAEPLDVVLFDELLKKAPPSKLKDQLAKLLKTEPASTLRNAINLVLVQYDLPTDEKLKNAETERAASLTAFGMAALRMMVLDEQLESFISEVPAGLDVPDGVVFKRDCSYRCDDLVKAMRDAGKEVTKEVYNFANFGEEIPTRDEIRYFQKQLWIQQAVTDVLVKSKILGLQEMRFDPFDTTLGRTSAYFIRPTFQLTLRMRYSDLGDVLAALLESPRRITVREERVEREGASSGPALLPGGRKKEEVVQVEIIHLVCDYLDPTLAVQEVRLDLEKALDAKKSPNVQDALKAWADKQAKSDDPGLAYLGRLLARPSSLQVGKTEGNEFVVELVKAKDIETDAKRFQGAGPVEFSLIEKDATGKVADLGVRCKVAPVKLQ